MIYFPFWFIPHSVAAATSVDEGFNLLKSAIQGIIEKKIHPFIDTFDFEGGHRKNDSPIELLAS